MRNNHFIARNEGLNNGHLPPNVCDIETTARAGFMRVSGTSVRRTEQSYTVCIEFKHARRQQPKHAIWLVLWEMRHQKVCTWGGVSLSRCVCQRLQYASGI